MPARARWLRMRSIQARSSSSLRALASESIGCRCVTLSSRSSGSPPGRWGGGVGGAAAGALGGRGGREQLGVLGLDRAQLVEEAVVLLVADDRVVEDVVAAAVLAQLVAQRGGARGDLGGSAHSTSRAAGASSRARS